MQLLFLNTWTDNAIVQALSWTLLHSLWQGLVAALLTAVIITATRKSTAKLRYNLLGVTILLFLAGTVVTFIQQLDSIYAAKDATAAAVAVNSTVVTSTAVTEPGTVTSQLSAWFSEYNGLLMAGWAFFFLFHCLKIATGLAGVRRLRYYKTQAVPELWTSRLEELCVALGIRRKVQLLQSGLVKMPVAIGVLKPVILVPVGLFANIPPEQAETILLHELSHIRRKDYLVNLLQHFADAVFFFNPGLRWVSSLLRQEREACCDDMVLERTGQKRDYLDALVSFQEYSIGHSSFAMGIGQKRFHLLNRVKRIITRENKRLDLAEILFLVGGLVIFSAFTYIRQVPMNNDQEAAAFNSTPVSNQFVRFVPGVRGHTIQPKTDTVPESRIRVKEQRLEQLKEKRLERQRDTTRISRQPLEERKLQPKDSITVVKANLSAVKAGSQKRIEKLRSDLVEKRAEASRIREKMTAFRNEMKVEVREEQKTGENTGQKKVVEKTNNGKKVLHEEVKKQFTKKIEEIEKIKDEIESIKQEYRNENRNSDRNENRNDGRGDGGDPVTKDDRKVLYFKMDQKMEFTKSIKLDDKKLVLHSVELERKKIDIKPFSDGEKDVKYFKFNADLKTRTKLNIKQDNGQVKPAKSPDSPKQPKPKQFQPPPDRTLL